MKRSFQISFLLLCSFILFTSEKCTDVDVNKTANVEQKMTEQNQSKLLSVQPPPRVSWSLERDNLIKRFKLMNDRSVVMYMYLFNYGIAKPIGYYQVNKVSSVNSQLTNPEQMIDDKHGGFESGSRVLPSPAEDGSYGTNGDAIFGFTPDQIYIEHNMQYICSTAPLKFNDDTPKIADIGISEKEQLIKMMRKAGVME